MKDLQLSPHFKLSEFLQSSKAKAMGIDNTPTDVVVDNLSNLCANALEPLREYAGRPVVISSGYRSPALNKAVRGSSTSQHMKGEAADIKIPDEATGWKWFLWMKANLKFHQLIWEKLSPSSKSHWIHIGLKKEGVNKQQVIDNLIKNK